MGVGVSYVRDTPVEEASETLNHKPQSSRTGDLGLRTGEFVRRLSAPDITAFGLTLPIPEVPPSPSSVGALFRIYQPFFRIYGLCAEYKSCLQKMGVRTPW